MNQAFEFAYGRGTLVFELPYGHVTHELRTNPVVPIPDALVCQNVLQAIEHPIGCAQLSATVRPGDTVAFICNDLTRVANSFAFMPVLLDYFNLLGVQERSYGSVLIYRGKVLLEKMGQGHISLPKGHVESCDVDINATIQREIAEEIGIRHAEYSFVSDQIFSIVYSPAEGHIKRVGFKAAIFKEEPHAKVDDNEVRGILLLGREEANRALTFQSDRDVLAWAYRIIEGRVD